MSEAYVHPTAIIDENVVIGAGTRVWHFSHVMADAQIGQDCVLGQGTFVGRGVEIGDRCRLQNNVSVFEGVTLEDAVFCGPSVVFTNDLTPRADFPKNGRYVPTLVCNGASLGANATIVCGVRIGSYAMVGAGALVTKDVVDHALVVGAPARQIGWACQCGARLTENRSSIACDDCGRAYERSEPGGLALVAPTE